MEDELRHSKTLSKESAEIFNLIIDKNGKIIALNPALKKIIPEAAPQRNFFELFEEEVLISLQRIFLDARKYETLSRDTVEIKAGEIKGLFEFLFSPLRSENNVYFFIEIFPAKQKEFEQKIEKFLISTADIEKLCNNKKIISVIHRIKLTFPFTFIEKTKLQKEINEIDDFFWIKDSSGKFILINEKYASSLGFTSAQLENRKEEDFLPKFLVPLYQNVNNFINRTANAVIIESINTPITTGINKNINIIQFPICDLENKVVAIIGFSQKIESQKSYGTEINENLLRSLPFPAFYINSENMITAVNDKLLSLTGKNRSDILNRELKYLFESDFVENIENYIEDVSYRGERKFFYKFSKEPEVTLDIVLQKVYEEDKYAGTLVFLLSRELLQKEYPDNKSIIDALIQNFTEPIYVYDLENLKFLDVNDAALKLYGYKRNEFLSMDLTDLYAPEDIQTLIQNSDTKSTLTLSSPWRHKRSDGSFVLVTINRITIDYKNKKAHLNIIRDVTKELEEKKKIQLYQTAYENTSDLMIITDKDGFIKDVNENVVKKTGFSNKELEERPLISMVSDEDRAKVNRNIFHSGILKPVTLEINLKKHSGDFQKAVLIATPLRNYNGEIDGFSIIIKLEEEKVKFDSGQLEKREETSEIDSSFLSSMFHEILTPLNVIIGFTQELWESISSPTTEQKEAVDIIKENQKILMQIMDNAIEYSALLGKPVKLKPEQVPINNIITEIEQNLIKELETYNKEIVFENISSALSLETDKQKLITLLSLLFGFALAITKEKLLYVSFYDKDENIVIGIKDNKNSISASLTKGLEEVFSEEESLGRKNYGFSRFSMRLAKKLFEILSAKYEVIKKDNYDYEFGIFIPKKFLIKKETQVELERPEKEVKKKAILSIEKTEKFQKKMELDLSQLSCLYLEDQIDSQMLFKSQMKELKNIEVAPSLEAAVPLLKTKKFDFIIIDINLQGEYNGLDALRIIQQIPGYKNIPMIASTAYMQPGAREDFIAAGFTDFISKPLLKEKIVEILKRIYQ